MTQPFRLPDAGHLDRDAEVAFTFDGRRYTGYHGDTLASALLANGVRVVSRSFKYHRPRGILGAGAEEPNALVRLGTGRHAIPNLKATEVPLVDGLEAASQRGWPSTRADAAAALDHAARFLPPGFYYKTFIRPRRLWPAYEHVLRRVASTARAPDGPDPDVDQHERRHVHVDVLIVGGGPAGLAAALAATRVGARVLVIDDQRELGGSLLDLPDHAAALDGRPPRAWVALVRRELDAAPETVVLTRTSVFARYGHGRFGAMQYLDAGVDRQRHWVIRARETVLATGALERPMVFSNNDRPGVMLASAVQRYLHRYGVVPGRRVLVATNNDTGYSVARDLQAAGVELRAVIDVRADPPGAALIDGVHVATRAQVTDVRGRRGVEGVEVTRDGDRRNVACDLVCVAGGWSPLVSLHAQGGALPEYDPTWSAFVPGVEPEDGVRCIGAANGTQGLAAILREGAEAGANAAEAAGASGAGSAEGAGAPTQEPRVTADPFLPVDAAAVPLVVGAGKAFVDLQTDVHVNDIEVALAEGYESVEHVKRYTTLGMGTDQGRTGNVNAMHVIAHLRGQPVHEVGTTTFRPPYTPVTLGALAAGATGPNLAPVRYSPLHDRHEDHGAVFIDSGLWRRPRYYAHHGDDAMAAATLEARNVRERVGIADVSTLGKIALRGRDVPAFLDRVYVNRWLQLPVGRARFGVMLRDDGYVFDDGTTSRLAEDRFLMTTTTGNAAAVLAHLEFLHQQVWPDLDVAMSSVTDQFAVIALAGPRSRDVLQALLPDQDVGDDALTFMGVREVDLHGVPLRIFRLSFSGELAYELAVPASAGETLWVTLLEIGAPVGLRPYGLEAMDYLRIEKGHLVVGADIDGRVSPYDIGIGAMCKTDRDFIGRRSLDKPAFHEPDRPRLAGFRSVDGHTMITAGAQLVASPFDGTPQPSLGRITSSAYSPTQDGPIALGFIRGGEAAHTHHVYAVSPITGEGAAVEVVDPHQYDPDGSRMRG